MTTLLILLVVLPWSIWRQMHARPVTAEGLVKLPLLFAIAAVVALVGHAPSIGASSVEYLAASAVVAFAFGVWRGAHISIWQDAGVAMQRGNRATLISWGVLVGLKVALGTTAALTGWIPTEGLGEILGFLALTFAAQSVVVARRTLSPGARSAAQRAAA